MKLFFIDDPESSNSDLESMNRPNTSSRSERPYTSSHSDRPITSSNLDRPNTSSHMDHMGRPVSTNVASDACSLCLMKVVVAENISN